MFCPGFSKSVGMLAIVIIIPLIDVALDLLYFLCISCRDSSEDP